jgi:hypothetical protein
MAYEAVGEDPPEVEQVGTKLDVKQLGNGNEGHLFGVDLPDTDKDALVEYLKVL